MTGLRRRLAHLEEIAARRQEASRDEPHGPLVLLPPGLAVVDADHFIAGHRRLTGWTGTVIVLPSNGREIGPRSAEG